MTLPRTLEPEVMDTLDEALAYDAMDHAPVNRQFVADFLAAGESGTDILDLGAGTGQIPIELCRQCEACRVMAIDLSVSMLDTARINIELASLIDRIMLDRADAKQLPYDDGLFHATISNSIVHHVPEPLPVLQEALRVTAEGGRIFFRDLLRPATEAEVNSLVEQYAGTEDDHAQRMFRESLHAALTLGEMQALVEQLGYERDSVTQTTDRHWTWSVVKR
jgi:ubiquinone/menaquinone biosynthesis C-methylase UbiE